MLSALLIQVGAISQQTIAFTDLSYNNLLARAKKENKLAMIYFTGTGCSLCIEMEKHVFTSEAVNGFYNKNFISLESFDDAYKPDSATKRLRRHFGVISNPTFIFIDGNGKIVHKSGYQTAENFLKVGNQAISPDDNYRGWSKRINEGKLDTETVSKFLSFEQSPYLYSASEYHCRAQEVLDQYFAAVPQEDYSNAANWKIINNYVYNPYSDIFNYLLKNEVAFEKKYGKKAVTKKIYEVFYDAWSGNMGSEAYKKAERFVRNETNPMARVLVQYHEMNPAGEHLMKDRHADWQPFLQKYNNTVGQYAYVINAYFIYNVAKSVCEQEPANVENIRIVNYWMKEMLKEKDREEYDYLDVYAKTHFLLGNKKEAKELEEKAIQLAIDAKADQEDLEALRKNLAAYQ
jgi:thioredoxin-related protein